MLRNYLFDQSKLQGKPQIGNLSAATRISEDDLLYAFDVFLRYAPYGELASQKERRYLAHGFRESMPLPMSIESAGQPPKPALRFASDVSKLAPHLTLDEYVNLLHILREQVRSRGIEKLAPGQVDKSVIRDIAANAALSPKVRDLAKHKGTVSALLGGLAAVPHFGVGAAVAGMVVTLASNFWDGALPGGSYRWLRWAIKWDIESQSNAHDDL